MKLSLVIPCYNEEAVLPETARRLELLLDDLASRGKIAPDCRAWLVDDGSRDRTWELIEALAARTPRFAGVKLAANRGHQFALLAGLMTADGDAVISLDADLQDDLEVIEKMVDEFGRGAQIVYGVRNNRDSDTWFKRWSAERYYSMLSALGVGIVPNHADYRLMGRAALTALAEYHEVNLFLRGIIPQLGFRTTRIYYTRLARIAGETKYPLRKMLALALNGISSFSAVPLRLIAGCGAAVFLLSICVTVWVLAVRLFTDHAVPGWASTTLPIYALGGIQLLSLGVVGEYVAKVYMETKRRPRFLIERIVNGGGAAQMSTPIESRHESRL